MAEELIKERHSSLAAQNALSWGQSHQAKDDGASAVDYYSSSIASCESAPLPNHRKEFLFFDRDQDNLNISSSQEQIKIKQNFFKRLSLQIRDTLSSLTNQIRGFFKTEQNQFVKKEFVDSKKSHLNTKKTQDKNQVKTTSEIPLDDLESKRIKEVEEYIDRLSEELKKTDGRNIQAMMEMACKMAILVGSLGYRFNKKEIKDYFDHLEANIQKRVKTFEGGRVWSYITVGAYIGSAGLSFASVFGAPFSKNSSIGNVLKAIGSAAGPAGQFGQGASKMSDIDSEKKAGKRTQFEHDGEKLKTTRNDMDRVCEKLHQLMQEMLAAWRNMNQAEADAAKRAMG